ncbi:MAG: hypothetical protein U5L00_04035 [Desulfovermiculus sp.]|nr:hypothetical protein [Desulfovermiculus sp.]
MAQGSNQTNFTIQKRSYTLYTMQGRVVDLESDRGQRRLRIANAKQELEIDIPWQVEVEQGHFIDVVYAVDRDEPEEKKPYYIYDRNTHSVELNDTLPKPNKHILLALLDFVLIIIVGLAGARLIFPMVQDKVLWGLGALLVLMIIIYILVHLCTYRLFFKQDLAQLKAMNSSIKRLAASFSGES